MIVDVIAACCSTEVARFLVSSNPKSIDNIYKTLEILNPIENKQRNERHITTPDITLTNKITVTDINTSQGTIL